MRSQMRLAAALWSLNFLTGCTPGRLLQIATSRFAGQDLASSANSGWLLKLSNGVVVAAAASSGVACAVMLLWVSIVKVVIVICPLFRALRGHDMDHSARLETQGNSEQYRRWRTCGDGRRPEPRMIQNSLAFRPQERDACHDRAARVIKENLTMTPSPADGQNSRRPEQVAGRVADHAGEGVGRPSIPPVKVCTTVSCPDVLLAWFPYRNLFPSPRSYRQEGFYSILVRP